MPELPEVESLRLALNEHFAGRRILRAQAFQDDLVSSQCPPPLPSPSSPSPNRGGQTGMLCSLFQALGAAPFLAATVTAKAASRGSWLRGGAPQVMDGSSAEEIEAAVGGRRLVGVRRKGKHMWMQLEGEGAMPLIHLGQQSAPPPATATAAAVHFCPLRLTAPSHAFIFSAVPAPAFCDLIALCAPITCGCRRQGGKFP